MADGGSRFFQSMIVIIFAAAIVALGAHDLNREYSSVRRGVARGISQLGAATAAAPGQVEQGLAIESASGGGLSAIMESVADLFSGAGADQSSEIAKRESNSAKTDAQSSGEMQIGVTGNASARSAAASGFAGSAGSARAVRSGGSTGSKRATEAKDTDRGRVDQDRLSSRDRAQLGELLEKVTQ